MDIVRLCRDNAVSTARALQLIYQQLAAASGKQPGSGVKGFSIGPLPAVTSIYRNSTSNTSGSGGGETTTSRPTKLGSAKAGRAEPSGSCSTAGAAVPGSKWELSVLLTAIEWVALDPVSCPSASIYLLVFLDVGIRQLAMKDNTGRLELPAGVAATLLQPVLQLLVPGVLQLLHSSAATSGYDRRLILHTLMNLMSILVSQGACCVWLVCTVIVRVLVPAMLLIVY